MSRLDDADVRVVREYHERTKHHVERYAAHLGYMDWANQPDPFRTFEPAERIDLPHPQLRARPSYDDLFSDRPAAAALDADFVGRLFYHSLALSAWKRGANTQPWSLRINPSSGALHPTEGYLICGQVPGMINQPGVFHYAPYGHQLERRASMSAEQWQTLTGGLAEPCLLFGLSSIYWRESWKYGERAFRYCHHDAGHAIGAVAFAARTLGWQTRLVETIGDADLNRLLGTDLQKGVEAEHGDCLMLLFGGDVDAGACAAADVTAQQWRTRVPDISFLGQPNQLSKEHHPWQVIDEVSQAARNVRPGCSTQPPRKEDRPPAAPLLADREHAAEQIIRQRRSAVAMDAKTSLDLPTFYQMLQRTLPTAFAFDAAPAGPHVSLAIFVNRVDDLPAGLYLLVRDPSHEASLRKAITRDFAWQTPDSCPDDLPLFRLFEQDVRRGAKVVSCHQDIAADGAFAMGMLAQFDAAVADEGAAVYPRLFWETGLIGQVLYLEAEAAGIRSTGIGCFFDDVMHEILGITNRSWQSLYHFTVGGPVEDTRIETIPPYAHLESAGS